jgi:class 3 adenylate cyclase/tetratricopeptide (TPR) repeat protein
MDAPLKQVEEHADADAYLEYSPDLEHYLPSALWRRLSSGKPQRELLVQANVRLRSLLYLISTSLPNHLVQEKKRRPVPGLVSGKTIQGSLLFADVSGFTALSERLAVLGLEGAECLTNIMNDYFETMLEILAWSGGILLKFAGDATLVYFPAQRKDRQAQWAVRAAMRMLRAVSKFSKIETPSEIVNLQMKIGVATGEFLSASIGSPERMEYAILGDAVSQTMAAEGAATGAGQLIINEATIEHLGDSFSIKEQSPGFFLVDHQEDGELGDFEIRAQRRRGRGGVPLDTDPQAILEEIESTLEQIRALRPYLAPELLERVIAHAKERRFESEFRLTVVMFCNFIGPEKLLAIWGDKGSRRVTTLLSAYFSAMNDVIARYGGIVSRIDPYGKGTKLLALFGAPVSHQDDPLRAVRAATMMNLAVEELNERWMGKFARHLPDDFEGPLIQHRIGITEGETFAGQVGSSTRREYTVMGDDVNLSARLMGAAEPGQILINQPVHDSVADFFFSTTLTPIKVKGKSQPIPIYQIEGPRNDTLLNRIHQRDRLIGRDEVLARGKEIVQQALSGECSAVTIQGPAGSGKSHFADTLIREALDSGARLLLYQCNSYNADIAYAGWGGLLRSLAGISATDPVVLHQEKLHRLVSDLGLHEQVARSLGTLMGLDFSDQPRGSREHPSRGGSNLFDDLIDEGSMRRRARSSDLLAQLERSSASATSRTGYQVPIKFNQDDQEVLSQALSSLLKAVAADSPVVIFFEDAHWLDESSRALLTALQDELEAQPILMLVAQRGGEDRACVGQTIKLAPLDLEGTNEMVAEMLISDLAQLIHRQSNGSPLFIKEITHWAQDRWKISLADIKKALQTSDFLRNLVFSNLENLPENQREIARVGSVIGDRFRVGELQALLPSSFDSVTLHNDLRALVEARFLTLTEAGVDPRYAFQQKLVRDILYNSLPFARRRDLHAQIAAYLKSPSQRSQIHDKIASFLHTDTVSNPAQNAKILAHHYQGAENWFCAAEQLQIAADHLREQRSYPQAEEVYSQALSNLDNLISEQAETKPDVASLQQALLSGQGDIALMLRNYPGALSSYETALDLKDAQPTPGELLDLKRKMALTLPMVGRADEAETLLRDAEAQGQATFGLAASATMAWLLWRSGNPDATTWIEKTTEMLPSDPAPWEVGIEIMLNDFRGKWRLVIPLYKSIDRPVGAALASVRLGDQHLRDGETDKALAAYQKSAKIWDQLLDDQCGFALARYRLAEVYFHLDEREASRSNLDAVEEHLDSCPAPVREEGRALIVRALEMIKADDRSPWPTWRWQHYDDAFRIRLLFQP